MKYLKNITLLLFTLYTINAFSSNKTFIVKPSVSIELQDDWEEIYLDNPNSKKTYVKKDDSGELIGIVDIVSKLNFTSFDTSIWNIESDTEFIQRVNKYSQTYDILNSSIEKIAVNSFQFLKTKVKMRKHSTSKVETHYTYPCFIREGSRSYIFTLVFIELDEAFNLESEFSNILSSFKRNKDYVVTKKVNDIDIQIPVFKEYSVHTESSLAKYSKEQVIDAMGITDFIDYQNIEVLVPNDYNYPIVDVHIDGDSRDIASIYGFDIVKNQLKKNLNETHVKDIASYMESIYKIKDESLVSIYNEFNASIIEENDNDLTIMVITSEVGLINCLIKTKESVFSLKIIQKEINDKRKDILISEAKRIIKEFKRLNNINE